MRTGISISGEKEILAAKLKLRGRTDIIVVDAEFPFCSKNSVKFAIEVKTVVAMKTDDGLKCCLREAFLQLLGLNCQNHCNSPPVLLTDLRNRNYVLYLEFVELKYKLRVQSLTSFSLALSFISVNLFARKSQTKDLFRSNTPQISPTDSPPKDEDNDDVPESFSSLTLEEYCEDINTNDASFADDDTSEVVKPSPETTP